MRRVIQVIALSVTLCLGAPNAAGAWSNGAEGYDGFGTHDWILREAIGALGEDAAWVCVARALRTTDDPDSVDGIDHASGTWWHVWDEWGSTYGGAPEAIAVWFHRTERKLRAGDRCGASRALGILAHLVGDIAQPMHTDGRSNLEDGVHSAFEQAVDARCTVAACRYEMHFNGRDVVGALAVALATARAAHPSYLPLIRAYARHGYDGTVDRIARRQLDRAANVMADLIWSLDRAAAMSVAFKVAFAGSEVKEAMRRSLRHGRRT